MPKAVPPEITAYARHVLIGLDRKDVKPLAEEWEVSKATISDIRLGKVDVGAEVMSKIARAKFAGKLGRIQSAAEKYVSEHPESLVIGSANWERAIGRIALLGLAQAGEAAAAALELGAFHKGESLDLDQTVKVILDHIETRRVEAAGERRADEIETTERELGEPILKVAESKSTHGYRSLSDAPGVKRRLEQLQRGSKPRVGRRKDK